MGQAEMVQSYLDSQTSVNGRLAAGIPARDVNTARAEAQDMLNLWQSRFGQNSEADEWQRLLDTAKNYSMVVELTRKLEDDLGKQQS